MHHHIRLSLALLILGGCGAQPSPTPTAGSPVPVQSPAPSAAASPTPSPSPDPLWVDRTADAIGMTAEYTNRVTIADVTNDGRPDLLFANGGEYDSPGAPEPARVFANDGRGRFSEITSEVFGDARFLSRVIKVADLDRDGHVDIVVGGTYGTQTRLYRGRGGGRFEEAPDALPQLELSVGDLELGDVDADGDLDIVLADWGVGNPMSNVGGRTRLWFNEAGRFNDETDAAMPAALVRFSWDLELLDVDGDWDLDAAVSCKRCDGSYLFENDGAGRFADVTAGRMPQFSNNYEFEAMDLDGDGDLELVTINDGPDTGRGFTEHVFRNDRGTYVDATTEWWPPEANQGYDDNVEIFLDVESDGDADFILASLDGPDRVLLNDGSGRLSLRSGAFGRETATSGSLGLEVADLDGDGRLDVVESQGEQPGSFDERVYFGTTIPVDTAPPSIVADVGYVKGQYVVLARIHDRKSPHRPLDLTSVVATTSNPDSPMEARPAWYGEYLWRALLPASGPETIKICATDAAGNEACSEVEAIPR